MRGVLSSGAVCLHLDAASIDSLCQTWLGLVVVVIFGQGSGAFPMVVGCRKTGYWSHLG